MLKVFLLPPGQTAVRTGGAELVDEKGLRWIDVFGDVAESLESLRERFGLHRLAIEDCLHLDQRPKLEEYEGHLFLVVQGFTAPEDHSCDLILHELHMFLGADWIITVHSLPKESIERVQARVADDPARTLQRGVDYIAYLLTDELVDRHFPLMDQFSDDVEAVETAVFEHPTHNHLRRIFELKRALVTLRRVLSPQRDVINILSRRGNPHVSERTTLYFRDVYDHLVRIHEQLEATRDFLGNAMEGYLSMVANKTNEITKQLTLFATLFLPLSFITGFFGQNFSVLSHPSLFWGMLIAIIGTGTGLYLWFRNKHWL